MNKSEEYAMKIIQKISEIIVTDQMQTELTDDDNALAFFHALANIAPCYIINKITNDNNDILEFNHIANKVIHQFKK